MKPKTIEKLLHAKFEDFLSSIKDDNVQKLVKQNTIITGGSIASMLLNEKVNDYDLYFTNKETVIAVSNYYLKIFNEKNEQNGTLEIKEDRVKIIFSDAKSAKEKGLDQNEFHELGDTISIKDDEGEKYRPIFLSSNAITLSTEIQIIIRFYGNANEIHNNYDFAHCTNYWTSEHGDLVTNKKALQCLLSKELFYVGSKYPLASIIRIRKFIQRGWQINAGNIFKMCYQLSKFDLDDVKVLEEQLTGVDLAYFAELIDAINSIPVGTNLNYNYLSTIIDKIF